MLEAVFEELAVKQQVFAELSAVVGAECVLATNTSSLSVDGDGRRPSTGALVGLHFFNPVAVMPLVELVRTAARPTRTLATAWDVDEEARASAASSSATRPGSSSTACSRA